MRYPRRHRLRVLIDARRRTTPTGAARRSAGRTASAGAGEACPTATAAESAAASATGPGARARHVDLALGGQVGGRRNTDVEHGTAAEIHRQLIDLEPVDDRARHVRDHVPKNRPTVDQTG